MSIATSNSPAATTPDRLLRAYRATSYRAADADIRIGHRSAATDAALRALRTRQACLLGADNPRSRRMPEGWNRRARARLRAALRRVAIMPATGTWRGWHEAHVLAAVTPARARVLARRFRQNAFVHLRRGAQARLVLLPAPA